MVERHSSNTSTLNSGMGDKNYNFDEQCFNLFLEASSKNCQAFKMERFAKKINKQKPLPNFVKRPIF